MFEHWTGLFLVVGIGLAIMLIAEVSSYARERYLIKKGVLFAVEETTEQDILRLKKMGYSVWAIKRYRQLNKGVSLKQAKEYIASL
ncbi:hypothetical protein [Alkalimarinus alittae]|uniref:Uncharacterized protein n=1 Tax=Alkalimarinus alittae TaxID=2961619 RepID=A0ABY6N495_9ALTE|nr:hypothetical protein [Alkalimarinus alittae]UZE96825.1 hypothetical protein NKI27_03470 [Alkalimarinus alittae]